MFKGKKSLGQIKRWIPWMVTIAIVYYLVSTTDIRRFLQVLQSLDPIAFFTVTLLGASCVYLTDSYCLKLLFGRFFGPVSYRDMLSVKGTSYFLNVVNYNAGAGAIAVFASKKKGFGLIEAIGTLLYLSAMDMFALTLLSFLGLTLGPAVLDGAQKTGLLWVCLVMGLVLLGTIAFWVFRVPFLPNRIREYRIFFPFRTGKLSDYPFFIVLRGLFVCQYVVIHWAFLRVFGIPVPFVHLLVFVPIITFIGVLPISVAGLGTTQVAMRVFFSPYAPLAIITPLLIGAALIIPGTTEPGLGAAVSGVFQEGTAINQLERSHIDAYSTATLIGMLFARISIGLVTVRGTLRDFKGQADSTVSSEESTPASTD